MSSAFGDGAKYISGLARSRRVCPSGPTHPLSRLKNFKNLSGLMLSGPVRTSHSASPRNYWLL